MKLHLKNIRLPLAEFALEVNLELDLRATAVFGPSGAGKTSLLDLIAGLRRPEHAFVALDHDVLNDSSRNIFVPPRLRQIGYVPQDLALFPHLSVRQNLLYGQKATESPLFRFEHVLEVLEIQTLVGSSVTSLSGGEQQRVALARALLASPRLMLLDEPLASLDEGLKERILPYLRQVREEFRLPMLYVSHDRQEVETLCDEIVELARGKVTLRRKTASPETPAKPR